MKDKDARTNEGINSYPSINQNKDNTHPDDCGCIYCNSSNQDLIQHCKDANGKLYHRLNSLQVQVNRLREENKILNKRLKEFNNPSERLSNLQAIERVITLLKETVKL
jgi:hypothetical protein